jgi:uncharacterized membrane protein YagU involved in acid resistance
METAAIQEMPTGKSKHYQGILFAGLIAGTLDLAAAFINSGLQGIGPIRVLQAIAAGLIGAESAKGGFATAVLGVLLHFIIAFGATVVFYLASRKFKFLTDRPVISGGVYGIAVYLFMYFVVVPLSAFPFMMPLTIRTVIINILIHIFCVGLPIALVVHRFSK